MKLGNALCQSLHAENARILNFYDLLGRGVGNTAGIGILVLFGELIRSIVGPAISISIFLAGLTALLAAFCYAEFGVRFLKSETAYIYSYSCHGENVAFIFGWALILQYIAGTASIIKGVITFADGLANSEISNFLNETAPINWKYDFVYFDFVSFIVVLVVVVPVAWKLKDYTIYKNIFTLCNILLYLSVIIAGSFKADPNNWNTDETTEEEATKNFLPFGTLNVIKGAAIGYYIFVGFETILLTGYEVKNPHKYLPYATLTSIVAVLFLYEGVAVILSLLLPLGEIVATAALPLAFEEVGWVAMKWIIIIGAFFGFQTSLFGAIFSLPKILNAMANDGLLFPFLNDTHSKYKPGILLSFLIAAIFAGILTFQSLVILTIIGALFVSTIIAVDIVSIRYASTESANIFKNNLPTSKAKPTAKEIVQQMFRFNSQIPSEVTENTVAANLFLFCLSCIGLGVIFGIFSDYVLDLNVPAIISSIVFIIIILFSFGSIAAQPKSKVFSVFKVPLIPFTPCISIFLNIFLMMFLEPVNLVMFLIWMGLGIIPHFIWYSIKYCKGQVGNSSLYEINKFNSLKLNESIWKIKSEKRSFYAGSVNHAFKEEKEEESSAAIISVIDEKREKIEDEKKSLELKRAIIVQTPDLSSEPESSEQVPGTDEIIQWECVAEIHTEDEFQQESYELEVVDDNYKFLSDVSEEPAKEDIPSSDSPSSGIPSSDSESPLEEEIMAHSNEKVDEIHITEEKSEQMDDSSQKEKHFYLDQDVKKQSNSKSNSDNFAIVNELINKEPQLDEKIEEVQAIKENISEHKMQSVSARINVEETEKVNINNNNNNNSINNNDNNKNNSNNESSDFNKMKEFKEKLNLFLKNQINENRTYGSIYNIKSRKDSTSENSDEEKEATLRETIRTLNKTEIKNKLDIILTKGPPKRASLQSSFNIKIKREDKDNEAATAF